MNEFITGLPKVELHCHIEGTFEPELMFEIARRNAITLEYESVDELQKAYDFNELQNFLDLYYQGMNVLQTRQDFYDLTMAYLVRAHQDKVRHTEIFFDPQGHVSRGVDFYTVITGISDALGDAEREFGITSRIIMCFLRHLDEQDAFATLAMADPYRDQIVGVGLDSSERGNPPEKFERVFAEARRQGYLAVAHAGEEGPPAYIYSALDRLEVSRIDHGNSCLQDQELVARLVEQKMPLTVCPLSNMRLCVVDQMKHHPLKKMLKLGLRVTVNSDDPAYFGGYMNDNYRAVVDGLGLDLDDITSLANNSIDAAFIGADRRNELKQELEQYLKEVA